MFSFVRTASKARRACSHLAIAVAVTSAAVAISAGPAATPAFAKEKAPKADYSKGFVSAYKPLNDKFEKGSDLAEVKAGLPGVLSAAETPDDKLAAGQFVYNVGVKLQDEALLRQGLNVMLQSGKVPPENMAQYNLLSGKLAYNAKEYDTARQYLQAAIDAGSTDADASVLMAESYFAQEQATQGLDYLSKAIAKKQAAGQPIDPSWLKRGFAVAYGANMGPQAADYGAMLVKAEPSQTNWQNAIGVLRIYGDYDDEGKLDLMRLAKLTDSLKNERDYFDYIEAADARRLPGEVDQIIKQGVAAGKIQASHEFVSEASNIATTRLAQDKKDLPALASDARKPGAKAVTASAAGDAYLSSDPAVAEEMFNIALGKPGVDTERVLTRLGIAQIYEGKYSEAQQTLAKVNGKRKPIARLWSIYAQQKAGGGAAPAAAPATTAPAS